MSEAWSPDPPWERSALPARVQVGENSVIIGRFAFKRLRGQQDPALAIGSHCTMDGVQFAIGPAGRIDIGNYCCFSNVVLMAEVEIRIGNYVAIGWNTAIADSDFHPLDPAQRMLDALACSPLGAGRERPAVACKAVTIEDDVWIGPSVTILKGVRIGAGSFIEPGAVVTRDVPPRSRVLGNPAQILGEL